MTDLKNVKPGYSAGYINLTVIRDVIVYKIKNGTITSKEQIEDYLSKNINTVRDAKARLWFDYVDRGTWTINMQAEFYAEDKTGGYNYKFAARDIKRIEN